MPDASQAPATKLDIRLIMDEIGKLYDANERWKEEIIDEFKIVSEDISHDCLGANRDEIETIKDRVKRLERRAGIR